MAQSLPANPAEQAPESFPFPAVLCWCGDARCHSVSRVNPDRLFSIHLGTCPYNSATFLILEEEDAEDCGAEVGSSSLGFTKVKEKGTGSLLFHVFVSFASFSDNHIG